MLRPQAGAYTSDVVRAELLKYKARKAELKAGGAKVEKKGELERAEQLVQEQQEEAWQEDEEWDENDEGYYDQVGMVGAGLCWCCVVLALMAGSATDMSPGVRRADAAGVCAAHGWCRTVRD